MISPIVIVLLIVYGSHISDWLPSSSKHHIHAHPAAGHVIVIFSLFILGQSNEPDRPLVGQGLIVLACWILILMFTRTGKYASITALVVMLSHQVTVRLIAQNEKNPEISFQSHTCCGSSMFVFIRVRQGVATNRCPAIPIW